MNKKLAPLYWSAPFKPVSTIYKGGATKLGICIHHQAGTQTDLSSIFNSRNVSAHYSAGDGYIYKYVQESDRAWHTGTDYGNTYLIGIETRNSSTGGSWPVSDSSIESLIQCLVGIAQNQGWTKLSWHGDKNKPGYVCAHRDLSATACPGDYLYARCPEIVAEANKRLQGGVIVSGNTAEPRLLNPTNEEQKVSLLGSFTTGFGITFNNGKALDVKDASKASGAKVEVYDFWKGANQLWTLNARGLASAIVPNHAPSKCLVDKGGYYALGDLKEADKDHAKQFVLIDDGAGFFIVNCKTKKAITLV